MTKPSLPAGGPPRFMEDTSVGVYGPSEGQKINIRGKGACEIKTARLVLESSGHKLYDIVAVDSSGKHYATKLPAEVLQFTGWTWADSPVPFELNVSRSEKDWHIVNLDSQKSFDFYAENPSLALAQARAQGEILSDSVMVHPVFCMSVKISGARWLTSLRRLITAGNRASGPLQDCFTHPDSFICAKSPLDRLERRDIIRFEQDLDDVFERYLSDGIKWPAIGEGVMMCSQCFLNVMECDCE